MKIIQEEQNGIVCITINSRMGTELSPEFEKAIKDIVDGGKPRVLFNLGSLDYLRAPALRVILKAVKQINQKHGEVALCALNGYVKEIFEGNRFQGSFTITDSVECGIKELLGAVNST